MHAPAFLGALAVAPILGPSVSMRGTAALRNCPRRLAVISAPARPASVLPGRVHGRAVALATAINWGSAFLVSQFFLSVIAATGNSPAFGQSALFRGIAWVWIYISLPESKGQSLEQVELLWMEPGK